MKTVIVSRCGGDDFVEWPCRCGCGKLVTTKLNKYVDIKHYGKASSELNKLKKLEKKK